MSEIPIRTHRKLDFRELNGRIKMTLVLVRFGHRVSGGTPRARRRYIGKRPRGKISPLWFDNSAMKRRLIALTG